MSSRANLKRSRPNQIIVLWVVFQLGMIFHTQLGLMPLFHGVDVLAAHGHVANDIREIASVLWLMLAFFLMPLVAMLSLCFSDAHPVRVGHFWLTVLYSVLNMAHLGVDLAIHPIAWYQITLMAFLLVVGLLLNGVAYQWMRADQSRHPRLQLE
jgi:hypothetical protein